MVQREHSLAEWLADDMGNLRPEAVEFLAIDQPQPVPRRRRRGMDWLIIALTLILLIFFIKALLSKDDKVINNTLSDTKTTDENRRLFGLKNYQKTSDTYSSLTKHPFNQTNINQPKVFKEDSTDIINDGDKIYTNQTNENLAVQSNSLKKNDRRVSGYHTKKSLEDRYMQIKKSLGKARVFGFNVNIRRFPSLNSPIVRQTNQGESFQVLSFSHGWYEVVIGKGKVAFIFGAYLLPMDFKIPSHWVGLAKDRTKLLLAEDYRSDWFQIIMPNGKKRYIRKKNVQVVK